MTSNSTVESPMPMSGSDIRASNVSRTAPRRNRFSYLTNQEGRDGIQDRREVIHDEREGIKDVALKMLRLTHGPGNLALRQLHTEEEELEYVRDCTQAIRMSLLGIDDSSHSSSELHQNLQSRAHRYTRRLSYTAQPFHWGLVDEIVKNAVEEWLGEVNPEIQEAAASTLTGHETELCKSIYAYLGFVGLSRGDPHWWSTISIHDHSAHRQEVLDVLREVRHERGPGADSVVSAGRDRVRDALNRHREALHRMYWPPQARELLESLFSTVASFYVASCMRQISNPRQTSRAGLDRTGEWIARPALGFTTPGLLQSPTVSPTDLDASQPFSDELAAELLQAILGDDARSDSGTHLPGQESSDGSPMAEEELDDAMQTSRQDSLLTYAVPTNSPES